MTELRWGSATDIGVVRTSNQDELLVDSPLFAVADGMGGAAGGEVASATAMAALKAAFEGKADADSLVEAVKIANRAVFEKAADPKLRGMGTTMTAMALIQGDGDGDDDELAVVNVGDSRSYMLRDGTLQQLTDDHNVPGELLRRGELTPEEAAEHPQRNLVTRVLGVDDEVEVDLWQLVPYVGDRYLLASDGLFGEVADPDVATVLRTEADPDAAARTLVDMARDAGGRDNITVVIVDVVDDGGRAEAASEQMATAPKRKARQDTAPIPVVAPDDEVLLANESTDSEPADPLDPAAPEGAKALPTVGRLITIFVVGALLGAVAFGGITWYARSAWYLAPVGDELLIFRGRPPSGFLWVEPQIVDSTSLEIDRLPPDEREITDDTPVFSSLGAARDEVDRLTRRAAGFASEQQTPTTTAPPTTSPSPPPPAAP